MGGLFAPSSIWFRSASRSATARAGCARFFDLLNFSLQRGRPFYNRRTGEDQARFECETRDVLEEFARIRKAFDPAGG